MPAEVQVGRSDGWLLNDRIRLIDPLRKGPAPAGLFYGRGHGEGIRRRLPDVRKMLAVALGLACALALSIACAPARASAGYVDGISDQSLPAWAGPFAGSSFASSFTSAWRGRIALARYVVQWNAMAQASDGPRAEGDYREQFEAWLEDVRSLGLAPVIALTSYTHDYPRSPGEYQDALEALLAQAAAAGEPAGYVEAWNEPNGQGDEPAGRAGEIANWANSICERRGCQVIAGDLEDAPSIGAYERAYIGALDFAPAIWGIHPYRSLFNHSDATVLRFEQTLPDHGAGAQIWFTEVGAYYCLGDELRGEALQADDVSYLLDTLIPATAPAHVFYYGFKASRPGAEPCTAGGGDDTELYSASGAPRAAADLILDADRARALVFGSDLSAALLALAPAPS